MSPARKDSLGRRLLRFLKWTIPLAVIAGLVALAFVPRPAEVDLGEVTRGPMVLTIDEDGVTRLRERYIVSAPLAGRLLRVELDPGDSLTKGDVLATLDPGELALLDPRQRAEAEARVKSAEAAVARANHQLESARVEAELYRKAFARAETLFAQGNLREAAHEEAQAAHLAAQQAIEAASSAVNIATFDLEQARAALLRTTDDTAATDPDRYHFAIPSPIDARVLRVFEESSTIVTAGTPLIEIGDPADLELEIDVLSQDAVRIRPGQRIVIDHWGGENPLEARVRLIEPSAFTKVSALGVDEQRVNVIADLQSAPGDGEILGDAYRVEARIVIWESEDALRVPAGALFRSGADWAVYRLASDGEHAELVTIEIGRNNGDEAEVLAGLAAGDRVILHPSDRIEDGALIAPRS